MIEYNTSDALNDNKNSCIKLELYFIIIAIKALYSHPITLDAITIISNSGFRAAINIALRFIFCVVILQILFKVPPF